MIDQLNKGGVFVDQNYEGSNLSAILEILAYYTHVLMFYLNQTSSEVMFSQTAIYENMNRIVKLIDYKPTGKQTSLVPITCQASPSLTPGSYTIRKYSYFLVDNIQYTFIYDYPFEKVTSDYEDITPLNNNVVLYQGIVEEYPIYKSEGLNYETLPIVVDNLVSSNDTRFISHGSISVYVKEKATNYWYEYSEVESLFLTSSTDRVYDLRLNENGHYEVKFGNGIFGKKLSLDDEVAVFYILSNGSSGQISKNAINGNKLLVYNSSRFNEIYSDVVTTDLTFTITNKNNNFLTFTNSSNSTIIQDAETVDQIRENSPIFLSSQLRLVTETDYEKYLKKSIPNVLNDVKVVDNNLFISEYIRYFYDICVDPNKVNRVILNQVNFADSCDFNNVNVFCVPGFSITQDEQYPEFLSDSFKTLIKDLTKDKKIISNEVVPRDPIYVALDIGYSDGAVYKDLHKTTKLVITRQSNNKTSRDKIKKQVYLTITDFLNPKNVKLGFNLDMNGLASKILSIDGVNNIRTVNNSDGSYIHGLSFVMWNPMFEGVDERLVTQTLSLPFFKFPYLYRPNDIINRIEVIDE
jgi:hypothetical protein